MSAYLAELGERLSRARRAAALSQTDLAAELRLTRSSVANIEAGRQSCPAERVMVAAEALDCDPRWLLTGWEPGRPPIVRDLQPILDMLPGVAQQLRACADRIERLADDAR